MPQESQVQKELGNLKNWGQADFEDYGPSYQHMSVNLQVSNKTAFHKSQNHRHKSVSLQASNKTAFQKSQNHRHKRGKSLSYLDHQNFPKFSDTLKYTKTKQNHFKQTQALEYLSRKIRHHHGHRKQRGMIITSTSVNSKLYSQSLSRDTEERKSLSQWEEKNTEEDESFGFPGFESAESTTHDSTIDYHCAFSGSSGNLITLDDEEDEDVKEEGSSIAETDDEDPFTGNISESSTTLTLVSGGSMDKEMKEGKHLTTIVLPFRTPEITSMPGILHVTVTTAGSVAWDPMVCKRSFLYLACCSLACCDVLS